MYSLCFLLATLLSSIFAVAAVRLGRWAAAASVASMVLYFGVAERTVLATLPYVGEVAASLTADKWPFAAVSIALGLITALYAQRYLEHLGAERWYYMIHAFYVLSFVWIVAFENLIFVFLALELSIITSFLLIWYFGYGNRRVVGILYFLWAQVGSILFLVGVALAGKFDAGVFQAVGASSLLVLVGLLVKMGTLGVHFWLPYAHAEAPTPLSALLSPVHVGLMAYWIWRLKEGAHWPLDALYLYGLATAVYGSLLVFREADFKRALADSTIANMGLLVAAAAMPKYQVAPHLPPLDYLATAVLFVGHAFAKAAGFMLSGIYIVKLHTRELDKLVWDTSALALAVLTFVALSGVFGIVLVGKALLAMGLPHSLSAAALLILALFSTALYNFYILNRIYKAGSGPLDAPRDMYIPTLATALAPYALLAAVPWLLWLL